MKKEGDGNVKFGEFMAQLKKGVPHVLLLAGEERYYIDRALEAVLARLPHPERALLRPGLFPGSATGLEAGFALVSLDVDLEESTYQGLRWFLPRMEAGGFLLLHDYNSPDLPGVRKALRRYEAEHGHLHAVPLCDVNGTLVISL